jgi:hypothetical protein
MYIPVRIDVQWCRRAKGAIGGTVQHPTNGTRNIVGKNGFRIAAEETGAGMKIRDMGRKWMWWFLGVLAAMQIYFVRELLAAYLLFSVGFVAVTMVVSSVYMLHKTWQAGLARAARYSTPVLSLAHRGLSFAVDVTKRPLRRPGSAAAR